MDCSLPERTETAKRNVLPYPWITNWIAQYYCWPGSCLPVLFWMVLHGSGPRAYCVTAVKKLLIILTFKERAQKELCAAFCIFDAWVNEYLSPPTNIHFTLAKYIKLKQNIKQIINKSGQLKNCPLSVSLLNI